MSVSVVGPADRARRWYALAQRHRRMAERLLRSGFVDGTVFHAYHAYQCAVSALIAAQRHPVPPSHMGRTTLFGQLMDTTRPYATSYQQLSFFTVFTRNMSLYYDESLDLLPNDQFDAAFARHVLPLVHQFARDVWHEIR